jgi:hypothetical protein
MISSVFIVPFILLLWQCPLFAHAFTISSTISTRHNLRHSNSLVQKSNRVVDLLRPNQAEGRRRRRSEPQTSSLVLLAVVQRGLPLLRGTREKSNNSRCYDRKSSATTAGASVDHGRRPRTSTTTTQLWYKTIDQDEPDNDEEDAKKSAALLLKTQARTPPGFSVARQAPHSMGGGINQRLMIALALNQLLILGLACVVGAVILFVRSGFSFDFLTHLLTILDWSGNNVALFDFWPTPVRLMYGVLGAIPLLAVSLWVERSDKVRTTIGNHRLGPTHAARPMLSYPDDVV